KTLNGTNIEEYIIVDRKIKNVFSKLPEGFLPTNNNEPVTKERAIVLLPEPLQKLIDNMVYVEGGTFTMGCSIESGEVCAVNEYPAHKVTLNDFRIGKYEVTVSQWDAVMGTSSRGNCSECPKTSIYWADVQEFLVKLDSITGKTFRLPTEA